MSATSDWFVAGGTLALAVGTFTLAVVTFKMAKRAGEQVDIERKRIDAATQPLVYPIAPYDWTEGTPGSRHAAVRMEVLPLRNGGQGIALNVHGAIFPLRPKPGQERRSLELQAGTIAAGDELDARLEKPLSTRLESPVAAGWRGVDGFVVYDDVAGEEWVTHFQFGVGPGNQLVCQHEPAGKVDTLGDPRHRYREPSQATSS